MHVVTRRAARENRVYARTVTVAVVRVNTLLPRVARPVHSLVRHIILFNSPLVPDGIVVFHVAKIEISLTREQAERIVKSLQLCLAVRRYNRVNAV